MIDNIFWSKTWAVCGFALLSFVAGALLAGWLVVDHDVQADSNRVFELRIYHTVPGKLPLMESRFRDKTSKLLARHNLNVVGYWATEGEETSFVFLLAHNSREGAKKNWQAMAADPEFQEVIKAEQADKTLEKADIMFLRPTDFSALK